MTPYLFSLLLIEIKNRKILEDLQIKKQLIVQKGVSMQSERLFIEFHSILC